MLQEFELPVCTLAQHWRAEGLHDLLDRHGGLSELVLCRAIGVVVVSPQTRTIEFRAVEVTHHTRPNAPGTE